VALGPASEHRLEGARVGGVQQLAHQDRRLSDGEPAPNHHAGCESLVATWQRRDEHRRPRREQSQSHVRLHAHVEGFDERQAPAYPTFMATKARGDRALAQAVVTVERADDPRLLERGQAAAGVPLAHVHRRLDDVHRHDDGAESAQTQHARRTQPLEAIEQLECAAVFERAHGRELPMVAERRAHRRKRARLGQAKGGQPLAEIGQGDGALGRGGGRGHGAAAHHGDGITRHPGP